MQYSIEYNYIQTISTIITPLSLYRVFYSVLLSKLPPTVLLPHVMSLLEGIQKARYDPPSITTKLLKLHNVSTYIEDHDVYRISGLNYTTVIIYLWMISLFTTFLELNVINLYPNFLTGDLNLDFLNNDNVHQSMKNRADYVYDEIPDAEISDTYVDTNAIMFKL